MGLQSKLFSFFGVQHKKMKEKKSDSFFLFRKSGTRYSFVNDKKKTEISNVQIQRLSWSSFPVTKIALPEETCQPVDMPSRRTKSSENLKAKHCAKGLQNKLAKSKSSSVFKSPSATMRQLFAIGSSSSVSTPTPSSSSSSSASSSPMVRQSWCSGVTHILERCGNENGTVYVDDSFPDEFQSRRCSNEGILPQDASFRRGPSATEGLTANKYFLNFTRNGFPVASLLEEDEEDEIMITPKIICAHKKTPDVVRKTRTQIMQELEYIKELGMLPEELDTEILNTTEKDGNRISNYEKYPYPSRDLNLNALRGYKTSAGNEIAQCEQNNINSDHLSDKAFIVVQQDELGDNRIKEDPSTSTKNCSSNTLSPPAAGERETGIIDSDSNEFFGSGSALKKSNPNLVLNPLESSSLNSILVNDYDSEDMTNDEDDNESLSFEKRLEDDLEKLVEKGGGKEKENEINGATLSDEEERVQFRKKIRPTLYIDIEKARSSRTFSNERLLRRIREDGYDSARSSRSSPRSPRSPAIDIDDLFKQRQKKLEESPLDNLTRVKDLTQRLRLSTRAPSHIGWINGLANKTDARQLAQVMSPVVVEDSEGIFRPQEMMEPPTNDQREKNLSKALLWIKEELLKMKAQDQQLARQLVHLQLEMQRLRLVRSCTQHEALLEEVTCEEEEQRALMTSTDLIDLPNNLRECAFSSLRDVGVTRLNLANRRFSLR